jgi:hypothetical protein
MTFRLQTKSRFTTALLLSSFSAKIRAGFFDRGAR